MKGKSDLNIRQQRKTFPNIRLVGIRVSFWPSIHAGELGVVMFIDGGRSLRASELPRPSAKPHTARGEDAEVWGSETSQNPNDTTISFGS